MGIEPISSEPESGILSIELRVHPKNRRKSTNNLFVFLTKQEKKLRMTNIQHQANHI